MKCNALGTAQPDAGKRGELVDEVLNTLRVRRHQVRSVRAGIGFYSRPRQSTSVGERRSELNGLRRIAAFVRENRCRFSIPGVLGHYPNVERLDRLHRQNLKPSLVDHACERGSIKHMMGKQRLLALWAHRVFNSEFPCDAAIARQIVTVDDIADRRR